MTLEQMFLGLGEFIKKFPESKSKEVVMYIGNTNAVAYSLMLAQNEENHQVCVMDQANTSTALEHAKKKCPEKVAQFPDSGREIRETSISVEDLG